MTNELIPFEFEGHEFTAIMGADGEPRFVAKHVCDVLDIRNVSDAVSRLDDDEKGIVLTDTLGGPQRMMVITESGLWKLVLRSDKPQAKRVQKWITSEVLPSIRKTGQYAVQPMTPAEIILMHAQRLVDHERRMAATEDRVKQLEAKTDAVIGGTEYFTVIGYFKYNGLPAPTPSLAKSIGQRATHLSQREGIKVGKAVDTRWGMVNTYHVSILDQLVWEDDE